MALMRKVTSVCTLGLVNYRSKRDNQKRLLREQAKLAKAEREALHGQDRQAGQEAREEQAEGLPWYRQPTLGAALRARRPDRNS